MIFMPMVPEALIGMLACARIGAVHSVVFGGFAAKELCVRIDHCQPKAILTASCGIEPSHTVDYHDLVDKALAQSRNGGEGVQVVVMQRHQDGVGQKCELKPGRDHDWRELEGRSKWVDCEPMASTDPLYILYTSGTTGAPKGVVRDTGGYATALAYSMDTIFGVEPERGDVWWAGSDIGWVVGHSFAAYGPLLSGTTTVMYEGKPVGTPDAGAFWRLCAKHGVTGMFTAPTALRVIKKEDPEGALIRAAKLTKLRALFIAGERCDTESLRWAEEHLGVPVVDHWWQTESGWPMVSNLMSSRAGMAVPIKYGSASKPVPGFDVRIVDHHGKEVAPGVHGEVVVKAPLPPGMLTSLYGLNNRDKYMSRFPGYYDTSDGGYIDSDGYVWILGRTDDVINVAGHRLSTGALEEVVARHGDVAECAVIGVPDAIKGEIPVAFVVRRTTGASTEEDEKRIGGELTALVRAHVGPVASFKRTVVVSKLPKTRSGKVMRATMRALAQAHSGDPIKVPATIEDLNALTIIAHAIHGPSFKVNVM